MLSLLVHWLLPLLQAQLYTDFIKENTGIPASLRRIYIRDQLRHCISYCNRIAQFGRIFRTPNSDVLKGNVLLTPGSYELYSLDD